MNSSTQHVTEIRTKPDINGNSRRILIFQDFASSAVEVYTDMPIGSYSIHLSLCVTAKEFAEYSRLAKAQKARRAQKSAK